MDVGPNLRRPHNVYEHPATGGPVSPAPSAWPDVDLAAPMRLLTQEVPLSLLLDLALGPLSQELLEHEAVVPLVRETTA
jgi:hypothetical protein